MDKYIVLHIDCSVIDEDQEFKESIIRYSEKCFFKRSDLAMVTFEVIMAIAQFAVACVALPQITRFIDRNKITVSFGGYVFFDDWKRIIEAICKDPEARSIFVQAKDNGDFRTEGNSDNVTSFRRELGQALKDLGEKQCEEDKADD